jgi:hypothetical protein
VGRLTGISSEIQAVDQTEPMCRIETSGSAGETQALSDEFIESYGFARRADGLAISSDCLAMKPDGLAMSADGLAMRPDGLAMRPDGLAMRPDGSAMRPDGSAMRPDGSAIKADGSATTSDRVARSGLESAMAAGAGMCSIGLSSHRSP